MSFSFDARFGPSNKALAEIINLTGGILRAQGMVFARCVWELRRSQEGYPSTAASPASVSELDKVADLTANWWGRSLEWYSPRFGEVFLQMLPAKQNSFHVVYNEGRSAVRARINDSDAKESLLAMLTELMDALEAPICTYGDKSGDFFRAPAVKDIEDMLGERIKWPRAIAIAEVSMLSGTLLDALRKEELARWTVDGKVIVSKI